MKIIGTLEMEIGEKVDRYIDFSDDGLANSDAVSSVSGSMEDVSIATVSSETTSSQEAHFRVTGVAQGRTILTITATLSDAQIYKRKIAVEVG